MPGKRRISYGYDDRLRKYKSGLNIIDELKILNSPRTNKIVNELISNFIELTESISEVNPIHLHYYLILLLHDKKEFVRKTKLNNFLKENICCFYTSIYRDVLRKCQPEVFNKGKYKVNSTNEK